MKTQKKPYNFQKRIGNSLYSVEVHFDPTSKESYEDKILRLVKNDLTNPKKSGIMMLPQTVGLLERSS